MTSLVFQNPDVKLGFHISTGETLFETFSTAILDAQPLKAYQIYIAGNKPWEAPRASSEDITMARHVLQRHYKYACIHGSLMYNLAGTVGGRNDPKFNRCLGNTVNSLISELDIAAGFDSGVVVHVGASKNKEKGIFTISRTIEAVLDRDNKTTKVLSKELQMPLKMKRKLILENAAGEGNKIGSTLEEIAQIIDGVDERFKPQIKVCIDTAHIFGAGQYDFGNPKAVDKFFKKFDSLIGLDKLELFHLNDSRVAYKSKKDRHENLGLGYIFGIERDEENDGDGLLGLSRLVEKAEEYKIPLIGEPPEKAKDGTPALGAIWDYNVIKHLCPSLETEVFIC